MLRLAALTALCLGFAAEAIAQTRTIASAGVWNAFGGTVRSGAATCGLDTTFPTTGRHLLIQYIAPDAVVQVRLTRDTWTIPAGTNIPIRMQIDGNPMWSATAIGGGKEVRWHFNRNSIDEFETQFRRGMVMRIQFMGGTEPIWEVSLVGTNAVMNAFVQCLRVIQEVQQPTQPFSPSPSRPTQPFVPSGPTQPLTTPERRT